MIVTDVRVHVHVVHNTWLEDMPLLERCPHFRGCYVQVSMELGPEDVSLLERCPHFRGCYVQASVELGPEDVSLLERCPHFRGCYVQASVELGPEDVSLLGRCPHFRGNFFSSCMYTYTDIHSVSPHAGSTQGGTLITVTGSSFGTSVSDIEVDVDGVPCHVMSLNSTHILCWTGRPRDDDLSVADDDGNYSVTDSGHRFRGSTHSILSLRHTLTHPCLYSATLP